jgi:hypothetical protein
VASDPPAVNEDAGPQTIVGWASFSPGPANEFGQTVTYTVSDLGNTAMFAVAPSVAPDGTLTYTPAPDAFGTATFTVTVRDSGGTANGGQDTSTPQTFVITVNSGNDAPLGMNNTVTTLEDTAYMFAEADFGFGDPNDTPPNALLAVKITTVPATGSLTDNGAMVTAGQFIPLADITGGKLSYLPAPNANGVDCASFTFQVQDNGGVQNGGLDLDPTPKAMTINVTSVNDSPVLDPIGNQSVNEEAVLSFTVTTSDLYDIPANHLTLSATGLPGGASFNPSTGLFAWTPTEAQGGASYQATITATDAGFYPVTITVTDNGTNSANLPDSETIIIGVGEVWSLPAKKSGGYDLLLRRNGADIELVDRAKPKQQFFKV